jgi:sulfide:quinone oxidoreductase
MAYRAVIAGGGVAALEAVLALREAAGDRVEIELIAPNREFRLEAMTVAEPFGGGPLRSLELSRFCEEQRVEHRVDTVEEVWSDRRRVLTGTADDVFYDGLLLALGARRIAAVPGALTFRGGADVPALVELLRSIERGGGSRIAFVIPAGVRWSLPIFELALLLARWIGDRETLPAPLRIVAAEDDPLAPFGVGPAARIAELLVDAEIELETGVHAEEFVEGALICGGGRRIDADAAVALPRQVVPPLAGVPQARDGMIACDPEMRVDGLEAVWIAGDATWFPIKQGGIAAQQAEVAANGIAAAAGLDVDPISFRPVIRAALLTGNEPRFLRVDLDRGGAGELARSPLWWPPIKVAGPRLGPYLAREWGGEEGDPLGTMEDIPGHDRTSEAEHEASLRLALDFAELDAAAGEYEQAVRWLGVAERLNVTLPAAYQRRLLEWREKAERPG